MKKGEAAKKAMVEAKKAAATAKKAAPSRRLPPWRRKDRAEGAAG